MTRKPSAPARFHRALRTAMELPAPEAIARRILQSSPGAHNGLRAANYDGRVSGGTTTSHPERVAEERETASTRRGERKPDGLDDLIALNRAGSRVLDAIDAIAADCLDTGTCDDWDDALHTAHLLDETIHANTCPRKGCDCRSRLEDGLAVGYDLDRWVNEFHRNVLRVAAIGRRYARRAPSRFQQSGLRADEVCEFCALLDPPVYVERQGQARGCRWHEDMRRRAGEYPTLELAQLHHDQAAGRVTQSRYRRALSDWWQECGVRDVSGSCAGGA